MTDKHEQITLAALSGIKKTSLIQNEAALSSKKTQVDDIGHGNDVSVISQSPFTRPTDDERHWKAAPRLSNGIALDKGSVNIRLGYRFNSSELWDALLRNFSSQTPWTKLSVVVAFIVIVINFVGIFTPAWTVFQNGRISAYVGLFQLYYRNSLVKSHREDKTYSLTGMFPLHYTLNVPYDVVHKWMWTSRLLALGGIAAMCATIFLVLFHALTTRNCDECNENVEYKLLVKQCLILVLFFLGTFLPTLAILFWHGSACQVCLWVENLAESMVVSESGDSFEFHPGKYKTLLALQLERANALPNQVEKETVYIGHVNEAQSDHEMKSFSICSPGLKPNLIGGIDIDIAPIVPAIDHDETFKSPSPNMTSDQYHHAIHGTYTEEMRIKESLAIGRTLDIDHTIYQCEASSSILLILACFFLGIIFLVFNLAATRGRFMSYKSYLLSSRSRSI